jgi:hypothetical protein
VTVRNYFRSSAWYYSHGAPTLIMTLSIMALLALRIWAASVETPSPKLLRLLTLLLSVCVVLFGLLVYARFVTLV